MKPLTVVTAVLTLLIFALPTSGVSGQTTPPLPPLSANAAVFATGLDSPRRLKFGADGNLYVAEGGTGGSHSTVGTCAQVPPPIGPYTGASSGARISKITPAGVRLTVVAGLPSSQTSQGSGKLVSGVSDVAFIGIRFMLSMLEQAVPMASQTCPMKSSALVRTAGGGRSPIRVRSCKRIPLRIPSATILSRMKRPIA